MRNGASGSSRWAFQASHSTVDAVGTPAEVPRRASVNEAFQLGDRLGDRTDVAASSLARIFLGFLLRDLTQRPELPDGVPATGVIR